MKDISGMTREQLLEHIIYLQEKLSRLNEDKLDKIQNDINWIVQYLLKQDKPVQPPPFVQTYYNPLYPQVISQEPQCPKCKMRLDQVMGYVCGDVNCPTFTKVTSNTHIWTADEP